MNVAKAMPKPKGVRLLMNGKPVLLKAFGQPLPGFVVMREFMSKAEAEAAMAANGPGEFVVVE